MLHIVNLEEIQGTLLRVPELIRSLDGREPQFVGDAKDWLSQAEQALINNRLAVAAGVAALRGVLITAERGVIPPGVVFIGRATSRKVKDATAADVIRKTEELISNAIKADVARIAEAEQLMRQIVSVAQRKGLIPASPNGTDHSVMLRLLWLAMTSDPDTGAAATHLAGLVGMHDALILLDRTLLVVAWTG